MAKPKNPAANVDKFMLRTEEIRRGTEYVNELGKIKAFTTWAEGGSKQNKREQQKRNTKNAVEELTHLNHELKTRRRAKLADFFAMEEQRYEQELNDKGLALSKARV